MSYPAQFGILMIIVGLVLIAQPYMMAKWHKNDDTVQKQLHKREQTHKKKKNRVEYRPADPDDIKEPGNAVVIAVRIIGIVLAAMGVFFFWKYYLAL